MKYLTNRLLGICFLLLLVGPSFAQQKETRVALVIGNSRYINSNYPNSWDPSFIKAETDAEALRQTLTGLGFDVVFGVNQTKAQTEELIRRFGEKLNAPNVVSLFYFAGKIWTIGGENYIQPVDVNKKSVDEITGSSILLKTVFWENYKAQSRVNIVLLDSFSGFSLESAPADTIVFQSAGKGSPAFERCGSNNYLVASLRDRLDGPKIELRKLLEAVARDIETNTAGEQKPAISGNLTKPLYLNSIQPGTIKMRKQSLASLVDRFKAGLKCGCGSREEALIDGRKIIAQYSKDRFNRDLIKAVRKRIGVIEAEEPVCRLNNAYDRNYKSKNWPELFSAGRRIMAREGDQGLGFDVLLDLVSVGLNRMEVDKNYAFQTETLDYAQKGLKLLDAGVKTKNLGVFEPFRTSDSARCWLNYTIGLIYEKRLDRKLDGLEYYYRATLYGPEKKDDGIIFIKLGDYYFEQATKLIEENRTRKAGDTQADLDFRTGLAYADRALDAFGRCLRKMKTKYAPASTMKQLVAQLRTIYRFRFNLRTDAAEEEVLNYVEKLIAGPPPDPAVPVEPVALRAP